MAWCYKADPKSNSSREATTDGAPCPYTFKYINYKGKHSTDNTKYSFWYYYFDKQWHFNKAGELHTSHTSNSNIQYSRVDNF